MTLGRRGVAVVLALLATAGTAGVWYVLAGRNLVVDAVRTNRRAILRSLLSGPSPYSSTDYVNASDRFVFAAVGIAVLIAAIVALGPVADPAMRRLYARLQRLPAPATRLWWAVATLAAAGGLAAFIGFGVLQTFPNSGDEACYLYQAETFLRGRLTNAPHAQQEFFGFFHIRQVDNRLFSVFPPGWPAVLAASLWSGVPAWLVNPVLGIGVLLLTFVLARRLYDERVAVAAAGVLAVSPFFLFNAASYFAHTFCTLVILAYAYCGTRALDEQRLGWAASAAACLGVGLLTRNYTTVWCAVPFAAALAMRGRFGWRALAVCAAAGLPFVLVSLAYNTATMGDPFVLALSGVEAYDNQWFPDRWVGRGLEITADHLLRLVAWTPPALLGVFLWAWRGRRERRFTDYLFPMLVFAYFVHINRGGNQYGPRFYHEALPFVVMVAAAGLLRERSYDGMSPAGRWAFYLTAASVAACVPMTALHATTEARVVSERAEPFRLARERGLTNAVVLMSSGSGWTRPMSALDLTRNDPDFSNDTLFAHDLGARNLSLMQHYPHRTFWRYAFDPVTRLGEISRVPPAAATGGTMR